MALVHLRDIRLSFGAAPVLEGINLSIRPGERICLLGRNGAGKSSLLKILAGELDSEAGTLQRKQGLRTALLEQRVTDHREQTTFAVIAGGLQDSARLLLRFEQLSQQIAERADARDLAELEQVQRQMDADASWHLQTRVNNTLSRLKLSADTPFNALSGGQKRRALLARALVSEPDLLLLDEPTNHLDIDSIEWLEQFLSAYRGTLLFVSHDRRFAQRLATRILDLDRGALTDWPGNYADYLAARQTRLDNEARQAAALDKKLAAEEQWLRQGIKARRTRNEGRVRALKALRQQQQARREASPTTGFHRLETGQSGKLVIEAERVGFTLGGKRLIEDFSTTILRGDKVGIIGDNGCGKSTLLRLLLGELQADTGTVRHGSKLATAYFDQMRAQLEAHRSVLDNVSDGRETILIHGTERHVIGYLQDFLFSPERARTPVSALSGGECNRLLLARLFSKPANLLVLDEPTNDLDVETLELLEALLVDYKGTLLLVSHDRAFLDNVATSTLVFENNGRIGEYVGGYQDWLRQRPAIESPPDTGRHRAQPEQIAQQRPKKLGYQARRELDALPAQIEQLEKQQAELQHDLSDPASYRDGGDRIAALRTRLTAVETALESAYARWERLEAQAGQ